jgi:hypothetical protein
MQIPTAIAIGANEEGLSSFKIKLSADIVLNPIS